MVRILPLLLALACSGDDDGPEPSPTPHTGTDTDTGPGTDPTDTGPTGLADLTFTVSAISPTIVEAEAPDGLAGGTLRATTADAPDVEVVAGTTGRLAGLVEGQTYTLTWHDPEGVPVAQGSYRVPSRPTRLSAFSVTAAPDHSLAGGVIVTTIIQPDGGWLVALDDQGRYVFWYDLGHRGTANPDFPGWDGAALPISSRLQAGHLLVSAYDTAQQLDVGRVWQIPVDAMDESELTITRTEWAHHDFVWHDTEGTVAWIGYEFEAIDGTRWAADRILEAPEGSGSYTQAWSFFDDYAPTHPVSAISPETPEFAVPTLATAEWTHSNSLMHDPTSDDYFLLSKFHDALLRIDRATGMTEWTLGGPNSDFTLPDGGAVWADPFSTELWSHAHMSHLWLDPGGTSGGFVVFDNGYHYEAMDGDGLGWSKVSEYRFDELAGTVEKVWEVPHPEGRFTPLMGDVRKLDATDGLGPRYLVGWSSLACIEELRADGSSAWEGCLPLGQIMGRTTWYEGLRP